MVRNDKNIKGIIIINNVECKQCLFADDSTFFLRDNDSFEQLQYVIKQFSDFSSLKVNYEKSEYV